MELIGRTPKACFVGEIGRVDDESVAFPVAHRIAHPFAYRRRKVRLIHSDDPGVMIHFVQNQNGVASLNDLVQIVIEHRQSWWTGSRTESKQAALAQRPALRIVICAWRTLKTRIRSLLLIRGRTVRPRRLALLRSGRQLRNTTVRWIHDD